MKILINALAFLFAFATTAQEILIFQAWPLEDRASLFVSISDIHSYDVENQQGVLPDTKSSGIEKSTFIELNASFRANLISSTQLQENDSVFIYEYSSNNQYSFAIQKLKSLAALDYYTEPESFPYTAEHFMFGFEIPLKNVPEINREVPDLLVAIGTENPFSNLGLTPIVWKPKSQADLAIISKIPIDDNFYTEYEITPFTFGTEYVFQQENYFYYLKNLVDETNYVFARHLYIYDTKTSTLVADRLFEEMEGISLVSLATNEIAREYEEYQYTGNLFKCKAPVIFNFINHSFDCPTIVVLDPNEDDIYINCDNRH